MSIFLTLEYVGYAKIYRGYRIHRDALATFGGQVRAEAAWRHWRYEVVTGHDGGLLLYLEKTQFIEASRAVSKWNRGELDAVVAETDEAPQLLHEMRNSELAGLRAAGPMF